MLKYFLNILFIGCTKKKTIQQETIYKRVKRHQVVLAQFAEFPVLSQRLPGIKEPCTASFFSVLDTDWQIAGYYDWRRKHSEPVLPISVLTQAD